MCGGCAADDISLGLGLDLGRVTMHAYGALCVGASLSDVLQQVGTQSSSGQKFQPRRDFAR
jgi:hypothetical protein